MVANETIALTAMLAEVSPEIIGIAGVMVLGLAAVFVVILNIANAKLKVEMNPTFVNKGNRKKSEIKFLGGY